MTTNATRINKARRTLGQQGLFAHKQSGRDAFIIMTDDRRIVQGEYTLAELEKLGADPKAVKETHKNAATQAQRRLQYMNEYTDDDDVNWVCTQLGKSREQIKLDIIEHIRQYPGPTYNKDFQSTIDPTNRFPKGRQGINAYRRVVMMLTAELEIEGKIRFEGRISERPNTGYYLV